MPNLHNAVPPSDSLPCFTGVSITLDEGVLLELHEELGRGAYGVVYRATDNSKPPARSAQRGFAPPQRRRQFAVKVMTRFQDGSFGRKLQMREHSIHEKASAQNHPSILLLHTVVEDVDYVYTVTEFCSGGDLFTAIETGGIFYKKDERIKDVFVQLIDVVHFCHGKDIYHRDLKPENVLLLDEDQGDNLTIRLADFGLACEERMSRDFGSGSQFYMSPEIACERYRHYGHYDTVHSDVWALGVILSSMITGSCPWTNVKSGSFKAYTKSPATFLRSCLPLSHEADALLQRVFKITPSARISLPELREEVLKIKTFFMSEEDLCLPTTSIGAKITARRYEYYAKAAAAVLEANVLASEQFHFVDDSDSDSDNSACDTPDIDEPYIWSGIVMRHMLDSEEELEWHDDGPVVQEQIDFIPPSPVPSPIEESPFLIAGFLQQDEVYLPTLEFSPFLVSSNPVASASASSLMVPVDTFGRLLSASSSSSAASSAGPITPETRPVDPDIEVPDIAEDQPGANVGELWNATGGLKHRVDVDYDAEAEAVGLPSPKLVEMALKQNSPPPIPPRSLLRNEGRPPRPIAS